MKELLYNIFMFWRSVDRKYERIKGDPEKSGTSVNLGLTSIILSIVGTVLVVAFAYFAYKCFTWADDGLIVLLIYLGGAICFLFSIGCFASLVLASIVYAVYQRKLNRKPIGLAALIISIILSISTVVAVIVIIFVFG